MVRQAHHPEPSRRVNLKSQYPITETRLNLRKVVKRTAEQKNIEPQNFEGRNSVYYKLIESSDSTNPKSAI